MALLLTTRPRQGLALRLPPAWAWPAAALLAVLCVPPLAWLTLLILDQFPGLKLLLQENHPLTGALQSGGGLSINYLVVLAVLPALCEELAFRGFILTGLRRRFHPWTAVFLTSFLYALFQMNVFQFVPRFCSRRHPGPARVENRQRYGADGLSSRLQPLFHRPIYVSPRIRAGMPRRAE